MTNVEPPVKKKRKVKPLPGLLSTLTGEDAWKFHLTEEIDDKKKFDSNDEVNEQLIPAPAIVATSIRLGEETYILDHFNNAQLRELARNIGLTSSSSLTKFQCRKSIAMLAENRKKERNNQVEYVSNTQKSLNSLCRAINIVFSPLFRFCSLNDKKDRTDHEMKRTVSSFWSDCHDLYNDYITYDDSIHDIINTNEDDDLKELEKGGRMEVCVQDVFNWTQETFKKKIMCLLNVRKVMKTNMHLSGTHDAEPGNFVDVAKNRIRDAKLMDTAALLYFYKLAEFHPELDATFAKMMDDNLKGSTLNGGNAVTPQSKREQRAEAEIHLEEQLSQIIKSADDMFKLMNDSYHRREMAEAKRYETEAKREEKRDRLLNIESEISIAVALKDTVKLRELQAMLVKERKEGETPPVEAGQRLFGFPSV